MADLKRIRAQYKSAQAAEAGPVVSVAASAAFWAVVFVLVGAVISAVVGL